MPPLVLMLAVLVASPTLGRALWPGAATPRGVQSTTTAVSPDRTKVGFMPDGHRDPDPPPSLGERLADWRYGFRNTFTGYEVGQAPGCAACSRRSDLVSNIAPGHSQNFWFPA